MELASAHQGYDYQDLLVALRLVDLLLANVQELTVDTKLFEGDLFDDLSTRAASGARERIQIKHASESRVAELSIFSTKKRDLRLDDLIACVLTDRKLFGEIHTTTYRVLVTDLPPINPEFCALLTAAPANTKSYIQWHGSTLKRLDPDAVFPRGQPSPLRCLRNTSITPSDTRWVLERLIIEFGAPTASFNLAEPGHAERALLRRLRDDVGAGAYPNEDRSPVDMAEALIAFARAARQRTDACTVERIARRLGLRRDWGAVARAHPVNSDFSIARDEAVDHLVREVERASSSAKPLIVVGPPGQGKSWLCHRLHQALEQRKWFVAEHYCYLSEVDEHRSERVVTEHVLGSLMARLEEQAPHIVGNIRPRFAATAETLSEALKHFVASTQKSVALIVDGLDHIDRATPRPGMGNTALQVLEVLSTIQIPAQCTLLVLSQPGPHLQPLQHQAGTPVQAPRMTEDELLALAEKVGLTPFDASESSVRTFKGELSQRSNGNALYATYLCRELVRSEHAPPDYADALMQLPASDGTLLNYYAYLTSSHDESMTAIVDLLGLLDFSISRRELGELVPLLGRQSIDTVLDRLSPVLSESEFQGGVRAYHESFVRHLRERLSEGGEGEHRTRELLGQVAAWLERRGFFEDARAFRFLLPTLNRIGKYDAVATRIASDFAALCLAAGWMPSAIYANLAAGVEAGGKLGDWSLIVKCIELAKATWTFEEERLNDHWVEYADVLSQLLGPERLVAGLLFEGRCTLPPKIGLQICALVDSGSSAPPWKEYLAAAERTVENETRSQDEAYSIARARGVLRTSGADVSRQRLIEWVKEVEPKQGIAVILSTRGSSEAVSVACAASSSHAIALAELLTEESPARPLLLRKIAADGIPRGMYHRARQLGVDACVPAEATTIQTELFRLTQAVMGYRSSEDAAIVQEWLDLCCLAATTEPVILTAAATLVSGVGWYPCWVKFVLTLSELEQRHAPSKSATALTALEGLLESTEPFAGEPRTCDLYGLHSLIHETLDRALSLIETNDWDASLAILQKLSRETTTTLQGSPGGPLTEMPLIDLVIARTTPDRFESSSKLLARIVEGRPGHRYLSELARYRLSAARLALRGGEESQARKLWASACQLLLGYGFRKDATLWELLEPIESLGAADREKTVQCLKTLQPLCWRVLWRTDGKTTRHARSEWWTHLAKFDPAATVEMAVKEQLQAPNEPTALADDALSDVWRQHNERPHPIASVLFRIASAITLDDADQKVVASLVHELDATPAGRESDGFRERLRLYLARVDEQSSEHGVSNANEYRARDNNRIRALNALCANSALPKIALIPLGTEQKFWSWPSTIELIDAQTLQTFCPGERGAVEAISFWEAKPYRAAGPGWELDRIVNAIGYRVLDLLQQGNVHAVKQLLWRIARKIRFGDGARCLYALAEGMADRGYPEPASLAFALAWTRARSSGGWASFGGDAAGNAFSRALELAPTCATETIVAEIASIVTAGDYRTFGISKALIAGLAHANSHDQAFLCWDSACAVISSRLPILPGDENVHDPYSPQVFPKTTQDWDALFTMATVAQIARPRWDQKRRALVATDQLLSFAPAEAGTVFAHILALVDNVSIITWLLVLLATHQNCATAASQCVKELRRLGNDSRLSIRSFARDALRAIGEHPPLPVFSADSELLASPPESVPSQESDEGGSLVTCVVDRNAGVRLHSAERVVPGLRAAVLRRVKESTSTAEFRESMSERIEALFGRMQLPSGASLPYDDVVEASVQLAASGARSAFALKGRLIESPSKFEEALAAELVCDPRVAIALERSRCNRPAELKRPLSHSEWKTLLARDVGQEEAVSIAEHSVNSTPVLIGGELPDWRIVGRTEVMTQVVDRFTGHGRQLLSRRDGAIESEETVEDRSSSPLSDKGGLAWFTQQATSFSHLVGADYALSDMLTRGGLEGCSPVMVLRDELVELLLVKVAGLFELHDSRGPGVVMRCWQADYTSGDYCIPQCRLVGTVLAMRPDLFTRLVRFSPRQLTWREFATARTYPTRLAS